MRPWLAFKKAGIEFDELVIPLYQKDSKQSLKPYSPSGKVPVLITEETTIWDSLAICEFAAEHNSELWPKDQLTRALARSISNEMHSGFGTIRDLLPMNCRGQNRKVERTDTLNIEIARVQNIWSECLEKHKSEGPWLFGGFTIADAMYAPIVSRFDTYSITLNDICSQYMQYVLDDEHIKQWYDAAKLEPHVIQASEIGMD